MGEVVDLGGIVLRLLLWGSGPSLLTAASPMGNCVALSCPGILELMRVM